MFTSIMLFNHFMRECVRNLVSDENFFRLETSELLNTFIYISRDQIFVASMNFGISFLNDWDPDLPKVSASTEYWQFSSLADWESLINNNVNPSKILKDSNDIKTNLPEFLENWWINTLR